MQPTYLPWIGYFDLIDQSDVFVFYDTVQFEKQSWQQRNRIKTANGPIWLTVPVFQSLGQRIVDVRVNNTAHWRHKHWMSFQSNYARAPFWAEHSPWLFELYQRPWDSLADLNICIVVAVAQKLGLATRFVRSSEMPPLDGKKVTPLLALCDRFGADTYVSPAGAREYIEDGTPFADRGIKLEFQAYSHPTWPQLHGEFVPFLSALDLLLNVGHGAVDVLRAGQRPNLPPERP